MRSLIAFATVAVLLSAATPAPSTSPPEPAHPAAVAEPLRRAAGFTLPQPQTVPDGGAVTFTAEFPGAMLYTWYRTDARGTTALPGGNTASYTFTASYPDNGATYSVRVFDATFVQHRSAEARLTVTPVAAVVTEPPHDASVRAYQNARFTVTAGGTAPHTYQWQRRDGSAWTTIPGATGPDHTFKTGPADDGAAFRVVVGNAYGPAVTSAEATLDVVSGGGSLDPVARASLEWGVNEIYQGGNPANTGCNYFSAGTQETFAGRQGDVRIVHRMPDGSAQGVSDATKCIPSTGSQLNQRVLFTGGAGTANAVTGAATIRWTGAFTANAYSGMVTWYLRDPVLTVAEDGTGTLTATAGGMAASRTDPGTKEPVPPRTVTVATFDRVLLATDGVQISPRFSGVDYFPLADGVRSTASAIPAAVKAAQPDWGAWPESFVDFQYETQLSSYWHTSGLPADTDKPPFDLTVRFDSAPDVKDVPVILANPAAGAAAPYVEGRDLTVTADIDGVADLRWERSTSANGPWTAIAGETGETLTIPAITSAWNGVYVRIVAVNADGRAVSTALRLQTAPYAAPTFTRQPADLAAISGNRAVVDFDVTGNPAIDASSIVLERSDDAGATWRPWAGAESAPSQITIPSVPLDANGARGRIVAVNVEGARSVSGTFGFRVFRGTGRPQLVVIPSAPIDPATETRLTVVAAGFHVPDWASATETYSLDLGLFDTTSWQPGRTGHRNWIATSPDTSGGQIYHGWMATTGGTFTAGIRVPAGALAPGKTYGVGAFLRLTDISTWQDTFTNRSLDAWTQVWPAPAADGAQTISVEVVDAPGEFIWSIDGDRAVNLGQAVFQDTYLQATGDIAPITVTDTRAGGPAWAVSGQISDFSGGLSGRYLGWSPVVITPGAGAVAGAPVEPGIGGGLGLTESATLADAAGGHGRGTASVGAGLDLRLPLTTPPGSYTATLTVTALS
ncbi:hypothetical protein [Catenuloplanes niger]|uniref:Ig-like domain-containing protein n=1 Tax=Catenuloplanes niger TaxID=587534 RepID=A0AAE4CXY7_9ACTN|nr:hypothetical protein [Catenuloplanes niger]MDR7325289.1 hypothetical protein [Catenuloplanes niger]